MLNRTPSFVRNYDYHVMLKKSPTVSEPKFRALQPCSGSSDGSDGGSSDGMVVVMMVGRV